MGIILLGVAAAVAAVTGAYVLFVRRSKPRGETQAAMKATAGSDSEQLPPVAATVGEPANAKISAQKIGSAEQVPEQPQRPQPGSAARPAQSDAGSLKPVVLVAEDNPSNYKLVEVLLRNDYALLHANNGQEAVDLYALHRPPVVLMDISMPVMDGYDALRGIRELNPEAHVIALTAYAFEADRQKMMQSGFNGCLAKPLDVNELRRMVRSELEKG